MKTFELCRHIRKVLLWSVGESHAYKTWSDAYRMAKQAESFAVAVQGVVKDGPLHLHELTEDECNFLEFGRWEDGNPLRLIPIWLYPFLTPGDKLRDIDGGEVEVGQTYWVADTEGFVDNGERFGFLAFGIFPASAETGGEA
jgi:hypothetical protein